MQIQTIPHTGDQVRCWGKKHAPRTHWSVYVKSCVLNIVSCVLSMVGYVHRACPTQMDIPYLVTQTLRALM